MKSKINPNEGRNINMRSTMNYYELGRDAPPILRVSNWIKSYFRGVARFLCHFGQVVQTFLHFFGGDPVRAILGVIQFLYLNSNMSLIINPPKCVRKRILKNHFSETMKFRLLNFWGVWILSNSFCWDI